MISLATSGDKARTPTITSEQLVAIREAERAAAAAQVWCGGDLPAPPDGELPTLTARRFHRLIRLKKPDLVTNDPMARYGSQYITPITVPSAMHARCDLPAARNHLIFLSVPGGGPGPHKVTAVYLCGTRPERQD